MTIESLSKELLNFKVVELGQYLEENMPTHPSHSKFYKLRWHGFSLGNPCNDFQIIMNEHNGTHVDSFGHYIDNPSYEMIDKIPLQQMCGLCVTIDASFLSAGETLEKEHIIEWEKNHGDIKFGDIVLIDFNWMVLWWLWWQPDAVIRSATTGGQAEVHLDCFREKVPPPHGAGLE